MQAYGFKLWKAPFLIMHLEQGKNNIWIWEICIFLNIITQRYQGLGWLNELGSWIT